MRSFDNNNRNSLWGTSAPALGGVLSKPLVRCAADRDGDCQDRMCPQLRDGEPLKTGRSCPLKHKETP